VPQAIAQVTSDNITTLYVGTTTGLYSDVNGTFAPVTGVPADVNVTTVSADSSSNVYAIANHSLYVKVNGNDSFVAATSTDGSCSQINGMTTSVGNLATKLLVASNCGLLSFDGVTLSGKVGLSANLLTVAVTSGKANIYGINSADGSVASWNNVIAQPWVFNATNLQSPANLLTLDSDGVHISVGSPTGGFVKGTIDTSNPLVVDFSNK
jgi:hypothetical protein